MVAQDSDSNYLQSIENCYSELKKMSVLEQFNHNQDCFLDKKIPLFEAVDIEGNTIHSSNYEGKVVVINFWMISCPPCLAEMPQLNLLKEKYKEMDVTFIAPCQDKLENISDLFDDGHTFDFSIISDADELTRIKLGFKVGFPTTIIVDKNGIIRYFLNGGNTQEKTVQDFLIPEIDKLLLE